MRSHNTSTGRSLFFSSRNGLFVGSVGIDLHDGTVALGNNQVWIDRHTLTLHSANGAGSYVARTTTPNRIYVLDPTDAKVYIYNITVSDGDYSLTHWKSIAVGSLARG